MGDGGAGMRDIRMEELPFEFDGRRFLLRCNMNVLADVQERFDGSIMEALSGGNPMQSVLEFTAAMLNDYADEQGWPERYTAKDVGRKTAFKNFPFREIMGLVTRSMHGPCRREKLPPTRCPDRTPKKPRTQNPRPRETDGPGRSIGFDRLCPVSQYLDAGLPAG